mmetsp:Transcript_36830/g.88826  ORF Transcript_36830/g.88826 Transcript_36830/m.88826 type:complete len:252 (-) Transcript_36830:131-886(-)
MVVPDGESFEGTTTVSTNSSETLPSASCTATSHPFSVELMYDMDSTSARSPSPQPSPPATPSRDIDPMTSNRAFPGSTSSTASSRAARIVPRRRRRSPGTAHRMRAPPYILGETAAPLPKFHGRSSIAGGGAWGSVDDEDGAEDDEGSATMASRTTATTRPNSCCISSSAPTSTVARLPPPPPPPSSTFPAPPSRGLAGPPFVDDPPLESEDAYVLILLMLPLPPEPPNVDDDFLPLPPRTLRNLILRGDP